MHTVWLPMLPGDSRRQWDDHLLNDPRVTHLWDEERVTARWFGAHGGSRPVEWDAYFLYDRGATWEEKPSKLLGKGRTVIGRADDLEREIAPYLG